MTGLCVLGSGMVTALGYNAPTTLAALRAGVSAVELLPWADPGADEQLKGARVSLPHYFHIPLRRLVTVRVAQCLGKRSAILLEAALKTCGHQILLAVNEEDEIIMPCLLTQ